MAASWDDLDKKYSGGGAVAADSGDAWGALDAKFAKPAAAEPVAVAPAAPVAPAAAPAPATVSRTDKFTKGLRDQVDGGAQLLTNLLPEGAVKAGDKFNNWLADKTGLVGKLPEGGVDQQVRDGEKAYQAQRTASGETGFDGWRMAGNVASPANLGMIYAAPAAAAAWARAGIAAGIGGLGGLLSPVESGDFAKQKAAQVGMGVATGGLLSGAASGLARVISPNASTNANLQLLKGEGVKPTIGQTLGGAWNKLEEKATSLPLVGDAIAGARTRARDTFNQAAINRATAPIGAKVTTIGQDGVREAGDALSGSYNSAIGRVSHVTLDSQFSNDLNQLRGLAQSLTTPMRDRFNSALKEVVMRQVSPQGSILGSSYKAIDDELGTLSRSYGKSTVASEGELGNALAQLQALVRAQMVRSTPQIAADVRATDAGWANLVRVEGAAKAAKNSEGVFTPAQLNSAIQAADDSTRGRAVSRGTALMQDLGNAGQAVIGSKVPDSGTAGRMFFGGASLLSGAVNPVATIGGLLGGAAMYTAPMQALLRGAVSARPEAAQAIAEALKKRSPLLLPLGAQMGAGLLEN